MLNNIHLLKCFVTIIISITWLFSFSQTVDTIITNIIYKSYFSYQTHTPLFVSYILYKGGGNCSRESMRFTTNGLTQSATGKDYGYSGYDIGHMANAKDFAFDCEKERLTFSFYNALPQTPTLNRGCWKHIESEIRKQSQTDSLLIICGGYQFEKKIGNMLVPSFCFKIIKNLKTNMIKCYMFPNDETDSYTEIALTKLLHKLSFGKTISKSYHLN